MSKTGKINVDSSNNNDCVYATRPLRTYLTNMHDPDSPFETNRYYNTVKGVEYKNYIIIYSCEDHYESSKHFVYYWIFDKDSGKIHDSSYSPSGTYGSNYYHHIIKMGDDLYDIFNYSYNSPYMQKLKLNEQSLELTPDGAAYDIGGYFSSVGPAYEFSSVYYDERVIMVVNRVGTSGVIKTYANTPENPMQFSENTSFTTSTNGAYGKLVVHSDGSLRFLIGDNNAFQTRSESIFKLEYVDRDGVKHGKNERVEGLSQLIDWYPVTSSEGIKFFMTPDKYDNNRTAGYVYMGEQYNFYREYGAPNDTALSVSEFLNIVPYIRGHDFLKYGTGTVSDTLLFFPVKIAIPPN